MCLLRLISVLSMLFLPGFGWWLDIVHGINVSVVTGKIIICYMIVVTGKVLLGKTKLNFLQWATFILYIYLLIVALIPVRGLEREQYRTLYYHFYFVLVFYCFTVDDGMVLCIEKNERMIKYYYMLILVMPLIVAYDCAGTQYLYSYRMAAKVYLEGLGLCDLNVQYQPMGDYITLFFFVIVRYYNTIYKRMGLLILTFCSLYVISTQAAFISLLFATSALQIFELFTKCYINWKKAFAVVAMITVASGLIVFLNLINKDIIQSNGIYKSIMSPTESHSLSSRQKIEEENQLTRKKRIIFGDYGFEIIKGLRGTYSHTIIDLLDQYGAFALLWFAIFYIIAFVVAIRKFFATKGSIFRVPALSVLLFSFPMFMFIRAGGHVSWLLFPLGCAWLCLKPLENVTDEDNCSESCVLEH